MDLATTESIMVLKMTQWSEKRTNTESVNRDQQIRLPVKPAMTKQTGGNDETVIPGLTGDLKTGTQSKKRTGAWHCKIICSYEPASRAHMNSLTKNYDSLAQRTACPYAQ